MSNNVVQNTHFTSNSLQLYDSEHGNHNIFKIRLTYIFKTQKVLNLKKGDLNQTKHSKASTISLCILQYIHWSI